MEQQQQQQNAAGGQPRPLQMGAKGAYIVRLLMVGDSSCGKTSLVLRFDQNVFSTKFVTTIGVDYRDKMVKVRSFVCFGSSLKILCQAIWFCVSFVGLGLYASGFQLFLGTHLFVCAICSLLSGRGPTGILFL